MFALLGYLAGVVVIVGSMFLGLAKVMSPVNAPLPLVKTAALTKVEQQKAAAIKERINGADKALAAVSPIATAVAAPADAKPLEKVTVSAAAEAPAIKQAAPTKVHVASLKHPKPQPRVKQRRFESNGDYVYERPYRQEAFFGLFGSRDDD